jgi:hypothetical protein
VTAASVEVGNMGIAAKYMPDAKQARLLSQDGYCIRDVRAQWIDITDRSETGWMPLVRLNCIGVVILAGPVGADYAVTPRAVNYCCIDADGVHRHKDVLIGSRPDDLRARVYPGPLGNRLPGMHLGIDDLH